MVWTDGAPNGNVLCADESDNARAHSGGDVHRTAVVTDHKIELRGERGELSNGQGTVNDDEMRFGRGPDGLK